MVLADFNYNNSTIQNCKNIPPQSHQTLSTYTFQVINITISKSSKNLLCNWWTGSSLIAEDIIWFIQLISFFAISNINWLIGAHVQDKNQKCGVEQT